VHRPGCACRVPPRRTPNRRAIVPDSTTTRRIARRRWIIDRARTSIDLFGVRLDGLRVGGVCQYFSFVVAAFSHQIQPYPINSLTLPIQLNPTHFINFSTFFRVCFTPQTLRSTMTIMPSVLPREFASVFVGVVFSALLIQFHNFLGGDSSIYWGSVRSQHEGWLETDSSVHFGFR
jgi:hypothetical protein